MKFLSFCFCGWVMAAGALSVSGVARGQEAGGTAEEERADDGAGVLLPDGTAPPVVTVEGAAEQAGKLVTVEGTLEEVAVTKAGNVYLNFGGLFPNQLFSIQLRRKYLGEFPEEALRALLHRTLRVTGVVRLDPRQPRVRLMRPEQLQVGDGKGGFVAFDATAVAAPAAPDAKPEGAAQP